MTSKNPVAARFWTLQFVRLLGMASAFAGLVVMAGRFADVPKWLGALLLLNGMFDILFLPKLLARKWRTPGS